MTTPTPRRRILLPAVLALAVAGAQAAIAFAANPVDGANYAGQVTAPPTPTTISFKVAKNGKMVTAVKVSPFVPNTCGGGSHPATVSKPAKVKHGKFETLVSIIPLPGSPPLPAGTVTEPGRV